MMEANKFSSYCENLENIIRNEAIDKIKDVYFNQTPDNDEEMAPPKNFDHDFSNRRSIFKKNENYKL